MLTHQELAALVLEARSGSEAARNQLITNHVELAERAAGRQPDAEEALSSALLALVQAVDKFIAEANDPANFIAYVARAVHGGAINPYREQVRHEVRLKKRFKVGQAWVFRVVWRKGRDQRLRKFIERVHVSPQVGLNFDIEDALACCEDDVDRAILWLKLNGHTSKEVAERLSMSASTISVAFNKIALRLSARRKLT